ncbi:protein arginine N-methyltransferase 2-like isoform X2 [Acanthaster planci]|uniref:Protein arginine N-methyltransferase 2 n=1 Tax=Acanthaster planci TaxID=133434 RepID=A0A8B8A5L0_ACAPL|nr:protein arginine N-methyltransferase 2-like isoform X2 [Acanthaster planci]
MDAGSANDDADGETEEQAFSDSSDHQQCEEDNDVLEVVTAFADFQPTDDSQKLHLEMLQDKPRNTAYCTAFQQNQHRIQGKVVLDIGCGTGILSMFAVKQGQAAQVFAVEASEFAKQTQALVDANGMSDSIHVLEGKVESVELPQQVDLIVSEWMGTFLLFEWMIESVILARDRWLKEDGVIWPSHAALYFVPCSAEELYQSKVGFWESVHGFDFSSLVPLAKEEFFHTPLYNHIMKQEDCLSLPQRILQLDMKTVTGSELEEVTHQFNYTVSKAGTLHGFASWFQVDFAGYPSNNSKPCISLNTGPDYPLTHWKHTLFMMDSPITVEQGDRIEGAVIIQRNKVWRRHMRVNLEYSVTSTNTNDIQSFAKLFPIWR